MKYNKDNKDDRTIDSKRSYYSFNNIFNNKNLNNNEKLVLLFFINVLYNINESFELSNDYIAEYCSITSRTVSTVIRSLIEKGIIDVEYNGHFRKIKIIR